MLEPDTIETLRYHTAPTLVEKVNSIKFRTADTENVSSLNRSRNQSVMIRISKLTMCSETSASIEHAMSSRNNDM